MEIRMNKKSGLARLSVFCAIFRKNTINILGLLKTIKHKYLIMKAIDILGLTRNEESRGIC